MASHVPNESARLAALERLHILDTPDEQAYDDIVKLAAYVCRTPIALISLIDHDRQWFKAAHGVLIRQMPRELSFCNHTIAQPDRSGIFQIPDTRLDPRFSANPLVTQSAGVRFYGGVALVTSEACAVGTLCVVDRSPGRLDEAQSQALRVLAASVVAHMELRAAEQLRRGKFSAASARPIDSESLLRRHSGEAMAVEKILTEFQCRIGAQVESLRSDLPRRDAAHLLRLASAIEGAASDLSAEPLRESAHKLEASVLANDFDAAAGWFAQLEAKARDCIDYLPTAAAAVKRSTKKEE